MTNTSYEKLVEVYEKISSTSSRLEKQDIIADFLMYIKETDADITYDITLLLQGKIFPPWSDKEMGISTQLIIKALSNLLGESTKSIENKLAEVGDMGEISEELIKNNKQVTFFKVPLTVKKVLSNLRKTESITGSKSQNKKINYLLELYTSASPLEAKYITRTITERLRIGVGEGTLVEAIAQAYNIDKEIIDRAYMLSNDLGEVASRAQESIESVKSLTITPGKPIKPMLKGLLYYPLFMGTWFIINIKFLLSAMVFEKKYLVSELPDNLPQYKCRKIEQGYLSSSPVVRVRMDNDEYYLTYKGKGLLAREEYNLPLTKESYEHLIKKADGTIITKKRYEIPDNSGHTIELDIFEGVFSGTILAEVEFDSVEEAESYNPPAWFKEDVTMNKMYHNSNMSMLDVSHINTGNGE